MAMLHFTTQSWLPHQCHSYDIDVADGGAGRKGQCGVFMAALLTLVVCLCEGAETARITARGQELTILFGGDTAFGESYADNRKELLRERGYNYSLDRLKPMMESADFCVLNLEAPICRPLQSPLEGKKNPIHWTHWTQAPATLRAHGVRLVTLGNNHAFDYGTGGLEETFRALGNHRVEWIGAGMNLAEATRPWVVELNIEGRRQHLAVLGGFEYHTAYRKEFNFYAMATKGGVARLDVPALVRQIESLKTKYRGIFIVAFPHWGLDYGWKEPKQAESARRLIDAGADLIVGHGAHRFQEIEQYHQRWILYGLGNFVFNSPSRHAEMRSPPYSLVALLTFRESARSLKLYPVLSDNNRTRYQPRPLDPPEFDDALHMLRERSSDWVFRTGEDRGGRYMEWSLGASLPSHHF